MRVNRRKGYFAALVTNSGKMGRDFIHHCLRPIQS